MKTKLTFPRLAAAALCGALAFAPVPMRAAQAIKDLTLSGTTTNGSTQNNSGAHTFLSGASATFAAGSTLTLSGSFGGTPTGGTLNLSNLTLTLPISQELTTPNIGAATGTSLALSGDVTGARNQSSANYIGSLGSSVIAGSATGTLHTFANASANGMFLVTVRQDGSAANFAAAMVSTYGATAAVFRIGQDNTNPALTLDFSISGLSLQLTPGSGYGSTTWKTSVTPITQ